VYLVRKEEEPCAVTGTRFFVYYAMKVVNKQLSLMNYQLSLGHVRAFVRTFDFMSDFVNRFLFKNCGLTDAHLEILLTNCSKLD